MSVLLAPDKVALFAPGDADEHGWVPAPDPAYAAWTGQGNVQLGQGTAGVDAAEQGGHGPFAPHSPQAGQVHLPVESGAADGWLLQARGHSYALSGVREMPDPVGGQAGCLVAAITEFPLKDGEAA